MKKLLFVSYNHAKPSVADSVQNHRLIKALKDYYDIDILQRAQKRGDEGVWSPDIYLIDRFLYKLFPFLISVFSLDAYLWCQRAFRQMKEKIGCYDAVIMIYGPYPTRYFQYNSWNKCHNKIVSILYDPFYDNIFMSQSSIGKNLRSKIEMEVVEKSSAVIVNNKKLLTLFQDRYPHSYIKLINLCGSFDIPGRLKQNQTINNDGIKTLVHSGNIYGERRIDELNEAVSRLKHQRPNLKCELEIVVLGTYCLNYEKIVTSGNQDVIKHHSPLYGDALISFMMNADGFILIDPMDSRNTCFPSKLCEYYQYKKPIFGFAAKNTPSYDSLKESGHVVCDFDTIDEMVCALNNFVSDTDKISSKFDSKYGNQFAPNVIAEEVHQIISNI